MDFWCNPNYRDNFIIVLTAMALWSIPWKALALWKAARHSEKWWFIVFILVNTIGLLEIFYLFVLPRIKLKSR